MDCVLAVKVRLECYGWESRAGDIMVFVFF